MGDYCADICDYGGSSTTISNAGGPWVTGIRVFALGPETDGHPMVCMPRLRGEASLLQHEMAPATAWKEILYGKRTAPSLR